MTRKAQKFPVNTALKVAIVMSGRTSREIAKEAKVHEVTLSKIIRGTQLGTLRQQKSLAKVLHRPVDHLFPSGLAVSA